MKFCTLALDYDGTIARDGQLDAEVKVAIGEARAHGITVVIVTGRILSDLNRVVGDLHFVDAIVAENGAVLALPNGNMRLLGEAPPSNFLDELRQRRIEFTEGQSLVEADAAAAPEILAVIRELELPLVLLFNRGRLMVLPQGITKGVGLDEALTMLRLSPHNALGIGDAENDHHLLGSCEFGAAVSWGSKALQVRADDIIVGDGPCAVAPYIRKVIGEMRLPPGRLNRGRLSLGTDLDGYPVSLSVRGRNLLIAGDPQSGKSWITGLLCEQLILNGYSLCVIDAEGDYRTLDSLPGVVVFGGDVPPPELPDLARVLRHPHMSVVVDLSHVPYRDKVEYMNTFLPMLASLRRAMGLPHRIVVDEAHYFLHEPDVRELVDFDLGAYTLVTYRFSDLHLEIREAMEAIIVTRTTDAREARSLLAAVGERAEAEWKSILGGLCLNEAVLLPGTAESGGKLRRFELSRRSTMHVRHKAKYVDMQVIEAQGFTFTDNGKPVGPSARTLNEFVSSLEVMPLSVLDGHACRRDFSQWIGGVFHDHLLASDVRKIEQRYCLGDTRELYKALAQTIQQRYELCRDAKEKEEESPAIAAR